MHRSRQPGASLAHNDPPRIIAKEPIPAAFTPRAPAPYRMDLSAILPREDIAKIESTGRMTFHCVGDTGGVKRPESQHLVAQGMEQSATHPTTTPVSFCYHLVIGNGGYWNLHHLAAKPGYQDPETEAKLIAGIDSHHGFMTFEIGAKVINGNFTTVPRPQDSWSDPNAYNIAFDVFSYPAAPIMLDAGEQIVLVPPTGSHVAPDQGHDAPPPSGHGARHRRRAA